MSKKMMKAAVLEEPKQIEIKELPIPEAGLGEVEIDVSAIGVLFRNRNDKDFGRICGRRYGS